MRKPKQNVIMRREWRKMIILNFVAAEILCLIYRRTLPLLQFDMIVMSIFLPLLLLLLLFIQYLWTALLISIDSPSRVLILLFGKNYRVHNHFLCAHTHSYNIHISTIQDTEQSSNRAKKLLNAFWISKQENRICKCSHFFIVWSAEHQMKSFIHIQFRWNDTRMEMYVRLCGCVTNKRFHAWDTVFVFVFSLLLDHDH